YTLSLHDALPILGQKKKIFFCYSEKHPYLCSPFGNEGYRNRRSTAYLVGRYKGQSAKRRREKFFKIYDHVAQQESFRGTRAVRDYNFFGPGRTVYNY